MNHLDSFVEAAPVTRPQSRPISSARTRAKHFVLDTNVLLHDPSCVDRFDDNHVWIPVDVLSELDRFKNEQSERGANARAVHRLLTGIFRPDDVSVLEGAPTIGGGTVRLAAFDVSAGVKTGAIKHLYRLFPETDRVDHRILAHAIRVREKFEEPVFLITKDLNLHLKALAVGITCQDYQNDKVPVEDLHSQSLMELEVDAHELQRFASSGELEVAPDRMTPFTTNDYVLLRAGQRKTIPARLYQDRLFRRLHVPPVLHIPRGTDLRPANLGQQCFIDAMLDPEISLVTCFGHAGTGKTLVAVAAGLHQVFNKTFTGLTVSRPVVAMGETLGFLPGSLEEKMHPWLQPIYDAFEVLIPPAASAAGKGRKAHAPEQGGAPASARKPHELLIDQGLVEIEALAYIRGRSIPRRFFVLDEAQQLTPREAKTIVTRMSKGAKLVMVGDPSQIDNPYVDSRSNGLVFVRNRMKGQAISAHATLYKGERSELAELGAELL